MSEHVARLPDPLRAQLAAGYSPVKPLGAPMARALWLVPFAALSLVAAPFAFELRVLRVLAADRTILCRTPCCPAIMST